MSKDEEFAKKLMDMITDVRMSDDGENVKASMFLGETVKFEAGLTDHPHMPNVMCPVMTIRVPLPDGDEVFNFVLGSPGAVLGLAQMLATMVVNATYLPVIRQHSGLDELIAKTKAAIEEHDEGSPKPN